jgi:hypothetical protein
MGVEIQSKLGFSITKKRKGKDDGDVRNGHNAEGLYFVRSSCVPTINNF